MFQLLITSVYELPLAVPNHMITIDDFTIFKLDHIYIYVDCFLAAHFLYKFVTWILAELLLSKNSITTTTVNVGGRRHNPDARFVNIR